MARVYELTQQQDQFCREYPKDFNGQKAAIRSKYSKRTAAAQASRLLKNVKVQERIEYYKKQALRTAEITIEQVLQELKILGFSDITDIFTEKKSIVMLDDIKKLPPEVKRAIRSLELDGAKLKIKFHSKDRSLELLGKYLSMFKENVNIEAGLKGDNELIIKVIQVNGARPPKLEDNE